MSDTTQVTAPIILAGRHVRLEPLTHPHIPGLVAAAREDPGLYRLTTVPQGVVEMAQYVDTALAWREAGTAVRTAANTEAKLLMLGHAFDTWGVHRVCFHTDVRNERSREALTGIGAKFEGVLRAHRLASDLTPRDSARFSIVAAEWPQLKQRLQERLAAQK